MTLVYVFAISVIGVIIGILLAQVRVNRLRRRGLYPAKDKATMEDVRRLALSVRKSLAVGAYSEIYPRSSLQEAGRAVDQIIASAGQRG